MAPTRVLEGSYSEIGAYLTCGFSALKVTADSKLNIGSATANVTAAGSNLSATMNSKAIEDTGGLLGIMNDGLSMGDMQGLGEQLHKPIKWATSKEFKHMAETDTLIGEEEFFQGVVLASSIGYALLSIWSYRRSFEMAENEFPAIARKANKNKMKFLDSVDLSVVRIIYAFFGLNKTDIPSGIDQDKAKTIWLGEKPTSGQFTEYFSTALKSFSKANSNIIEYSVLPYLIPATGKDNQDKYYISSLIGLAPRDLIMASKEKAEGVPKSITISTSFTGEIAMNGGFGDMVDVSAEVKTLYLMAGTGSEWDVKGSEGSIINHESHTSGFKMCVKFVSAKATLGMTMSDIAVQTEMKADSSTFAIQTIGIDVKELRSLADLVAASAGPFDANALKLYGQVSQELSEKLGKDGKKPTGKECLTRVGLDINHVFFTKLLKDMTLYTYACTQIQTNHSFNEAVKAVGSTEEKEKIKLLYQTLARIESPVNSKPFDPSAKPSETMRDYAKQIRFLADPFNN